MQGEEEEGGGEEGGKRRRRSRLSVFEEDFFLKSHNTKVVQKPTNCSFHA
jgi:hypothetical protein